MPKISQFKDSASYYGTFFHELIHSTGTQKRLNREKGRMFGDSKYAFEELIAESGGMYLSATCGFVNKTKSRSATYIQGWLTAVKRELEDNKTTLVKAFSDAQKGADYILNGKTYEPKPDTKATVKKVTKPKKGEQLKMELNGIDGVNKAFNEKLELYKQGKAKGDFKLGLPTDVLVNNGVPKKPIILTIKSLKDHLGSKRHKANGMNVNTIKDLPEKMGKPILLFEGKHSKSFVVVLEYKIRGNNLSIVFSEDFKKVNIHFVNSLHPKTGLKEQYIEWSDKLIWENKKIVDKLFGRGLNCPRHQKSANPSNIRKATKKHTTSSKKQKDTPIKPDNIGGLGGIFTPISEKDTIKAPDTFRLNGELGKFIQDIQKFKHLITLNGDRGAGKTTFLFQLMNGFAELGMKVGFFSLEQGGLESKDTRALVERYVSKRNEPKIAITGEVENGLETVKQYANQFDVVAVDSWQKLGADQSEVDSLRQEFPNTIFVVIFQENAQGKMRGGSAAGFDATVVLKAYAGKRFQDNYIQAQKNRGNDTNWTYKIMDQKAEYLE